MADQHFPQTQPKTGDKQKEKAQGRMLLTPPARKMRMSRRKVEH